MKGPRGRPPRRPGSRRRPGGGAPESAARKRGAGARQVSSRELVHGGSEAARGGDRPLGRALSALGEPFLCRGEGANTYEKALALRLSPPFSPSVSSSERFGKSESWWGERVTRHSGRCWRRGSAEGGGEARVAAWGAGSTCGGVTPPVPAGASSLRAASDLGRPHRILFLCLLQGGALPAGVKTMVLTLGESWPVLVGKRFLSLSAAEGSDGAHDSWDLERVAEWPWLSGTIRAVSHTDVTKKDLKVKNKNKTQNPQTNKKTHLLGLGSQTVFSYLGNAAVQRPSLSFLKWAARKLACDLKVQKSRP